MQKGRTLSTSSILNHQIVLSLVCQVMFLKTESLYFILLMAIDRTGQKNINYFAFFNIKNIDRKFL